MRISDWSSDVCSSDLLCKAQGGSEIKAAEPPGKTDQTRHDADLTMKALRHQLEHRAIADAQRQHCYDEEDQSERHCGGPGADGDQRRGCNRVHQRQGSNAAEAVGKCAPQRRSEEHTSELQSLMRISYAVFCLKKKTYTTTLPSKH